MDWPQKCFLLIVQRPYFQLCVTLLCTSCEQPKQIYAQISMGLGCSQLGHTRLKIRPQSCFPPILQSWTSFCQTCKWPLLSFDKSTFYYNEIIIKIWSYHINRYTDNEHTTDVNRYKQGSLTEGEGSVQLISLY